MWRKKAIMSQLSKFISLCHPCSREHHAMSGFIDLKSRYKVITSLVTGLMTLVSLPVFGLLGVLTFRCLVNKFLLSNVKLIVPTQETSIIKNIETQRINSLPTQDLQIEKSQDFFKEMSSHSPNLQESAIEQQQKETIAQNPDIQSVTYKIHLNATKEKSDIQIGEPEKKNKSESQKEAHSQNESSDVSKTELDENILNLTERETQRPQYTEKEDLNLESEKKGNPKKNLFIGIRSQIIDKESLLKMGMVDHPTEQLNSQQELQVDTLKGLGEGIGSNDTKDTPNVEILVKELSYINRNDLAPGQWISFYSEDGLQSELEKPFKVINRDDFPFDPCRCFLMSMDGKLHDYCPSKNYIEIDERIDLSYDYKVILHKESAIADELGEEMKNVQAKAIFNLKRLASVSPKYLGRGFDPEDSSKTLTASEIQARYPYDSEEEV